MKKFFEMAIDNIIEYGDTDIFPYPIANRIFYDEKEEVIKLLSKIHKDFDNYKNKLLPVNNKTLVASSYSGFRLATQIDPIWNAYLLALVLSISDNIEKNRIDKKFNRVFSYRFEYNKSTKQLFDKNYGWNLFQKEALKKSDTYKYILNTDISDFYSRIYHHRLENCLLAVTDEKQIIHNIMELLSIITNGDSYGLPIGGPAARILAEIVLNDIDQLLYNHKIDFVRFVDDYYIFSDTQEAVYSNLIFLSNKLIFNQGLALQKSKTRIITSQEFKESFSKFNFDEEKDTIDLKNQKKYLLSLNLHYDPYSQTAEEDYEKLKEEIKKIDIEQILANELNKTRAHSPLMKQLIKAVKMLPPQQKDNAILSLLDSLESLFPLIPNVLILIKDVFDDLGEDTKIKVQKELRKSINSSYMFKIIPNISYAIRILSKCPSVENKIFLTELYEKSSMTVKTDIIIIFANWKNQAQLRDWKSIYTSLEPWEKRAFVVASYFMNDDGKHWRTNNKKSFDEIILLYNLWAENKSKSNKNWSIDL